MKSSLSIDVSISEKGFWDMAMLSLTFEKQMDTAAERKPKRNGNLTAAHGGPHALDDAIRDQEDDGTSCSENGHQNWR